MKNIFGLILHIIKIKTGIGAKVIRRSKIKTAQDLFNAVLKNGRFNDVVVIK